MTRSELENYKKVILTSQFFSDEFFKEKIVGQNEFTIYNSKLESIFIKKANTDTVYVQKYLRKTDKSGIKYKIVPNKTKLLGYKCDLVLFKDERLNMDFEIYYSKKIKSSLKFSDTFYNILEDYIPLKYIIKTPSLEVVYNVTEIIPKEIEKTEFEIKPESILKYIE